MSYRISKRFDFSASHVLEGLPEGHQCGRLHGHNYSIELELEGDGLDDTGMVYDYGRLKPFKIFLDENLDHRHLNDVMPSNPTAERMAKWLYEIARNLGIPFISAVRVFETPKTCAEYRP